MVDQDVTVRWKSEGADKAKADADKLARSQKGVTQAQAKGTTQASELNTEQKAAANSGQAQAGVLALVSAGLGSVVALAIQAALVLKQLTEINLTLNIVMAGVVTGIKRFVATAARLTGGLALVLAAVFRVVDQMKQLRKELDAAREAQERDNAANIEAVKTHADLQKAIRASADARTLFVSRTDEQIQKEGALAEAIAKRTGVDKAVAADVVGEFSGIDASQEQLETAAVLRSQGKFARGDVAEGFIAKRSRLEGATTARGAAAARESALQFGRDQQQRLAREARGGSIGAITELGGAVGADAEAIANIEKFGLNAQREQAFLRTLTDAASDLTQGPVSVQNQLTGKLEEISRASLAELQNVSRAIARLAQGGAGTINVNPTIRHPDKTSQDRQTRNRPENLSFDGGGR